MTIAAGLLCRDGVFLYADTELTGWTLKSHVAKVEDFEVQNAKVCFALSGNTALAWSAIQKCKKQLHGRTSTDLVADIEEILDQEYRRNVLTHPDYNSLEYQFLIGMWRKREGIELYSTFRTALTKVKSGHCIGIGAELASYLIRPGHTALALKDAVTLAAYVLACVKENITGCGGMSIYKMIRNDGEIGTLTNIHDGPCQDVEDYAKVFDFGIRQLLLWMADTEMQDKHFVENVKGMFEREFFPKRQEWVRARKSRVEELARVNPTLNEEQIENIFKDWSMGFAPKGQKPSKSKK